MYVRSHAGGIGSIDNVGFIFGMCMLTTGQARSWRLKRRENIAELIKVA
jgi:hypothetical protein